MSGTEFEIKPLASVFPIRSQAPITYVDSWEAPRSGGRKHEGVDMFAVRGAEVLAVADGVAKQEPGKLSGLAIGLYPVDGSKFVYAHLDGYAGAFPREVKAGDVIGYVGSTGNAVGTDPHLHFEFRPRAGGAAINPVPLLNELRSKGASGLVETPKPKPGRRFENAATVPRKKARPAMSGGALLGLLWLMSRRR